MKIHIGEQIKQVARQKNIAVHQIADALETVPRNIYLIFKSGSIDIQRLYKISEVLDHNFFELLNANAPGKESTIDHPGNKETDSRTFHFSMKFEYPINTINEVGKFMAQVHDLALKTGIKVV